MIFFDSYEGMRRSGDTLQTAVRRYMHPETGKIVVLVGVIHVAETKFYNEIDNLVREQEQELGRLDWPGVVVHYELIGPAPKGTFMLDSERKALQELRSLGSGKLLADVLQLPHQLVALKPEAHWINTDLNDLEVLRMHAGRDLVGDLCRATHALAKLDDSQRKAMRKLLHWAIRRPRTMSVLKTATAPLQLIQGARGLDPRVTLDVRNQLAFDAALRTPRHVIAIWGAGHLVGLHKLFTGYGFSLVRETWHTALDETIEDD